MKNIQYSRIETKKKDATEDGEKKQKGNKKNEIFNFDLLLLIHVNHCETNCDANYQVTHNPSLLLSLCLSHLFSFF